MITSSVSSSSQLSTQQLFASSSFLWRGVSPYLNAHYAPISFSYLTHLSLYSHFFALRGRVSVHWIWLVTCTRVSALLCWFFWLRSLCPVEFCARPMCFLCGKIRSHHAVIRCAGCTTSSHGRRPFLDVFCDGRSGFSHLNCRSLSGCAFNFNVIFLNTVHVHCWFRFEENSVSNNFPCA